MPVAAAQLGDAVDEKDVEKEKEFIKDKDIEEALGSGATIEDQRPPVFTSTFWEILCVASLVSAQLTNVRSHLNDSNGRN